MRVRLNQYAKLHPEAISIYIGTQDSIMVQDSRLIMTLLNIPGIRKQLASALDSVSGIAEDNASSAEQVAAATEEQLASLEEANIAAKSLSFMAEELRQVVRKFSV